MEGAFPFQPRDFAQTTSFGLLSTTSVATITTVSISGAVDMEISNPSATIAVAFLISPLAATPTAAIASSRLLPPLATLRQRCQLGVGGLSVISLTSGAGPTIVFTPGVVNG